MKIYWAGRVNVEFWYTRVKKCAEFESELRFCSWALWKRMRTDLCAKSGNSEHTFWEQDIAWQMTTNIVLWGELACYKRIRQNFLSKVCFDGPGSSVDNVCLFENCKLRRVLSNFQRTHQHSAANQWHIWRELNKWNKTARFDFQILLLLRCTQCDLWCWLHEFAIIFGDISWCIYWIHVWYCRILTGVA